jgi:hypothetical protein
MPAAGIGAKKVKLRRYWSDAESKRTGCRVCGDPAELHHVSGRANDPERLCPDCHGSCLEVGIGPELCPACKGHGYVLYVRPESVAPLCSMHHREHHDHGTLDLIPHLTNEEAACAVLDLGLQRAYMNLSGEGRAPSPLEAARLGEAAA